MAEQAYLDLLALVLQQPLRQTRNGLTRSLFGAELKIDLQEGFPLLTTKKMFFRGIVEELLFFLRGETQTKTLEEKGINIWKGNTSKEFLASRNLPYEEGDMGPMYGAQWRGTNGGPDQLKALLAELVSNPHSRRLIMTTLNVNDVEKGVLWPCHGLVVQFYVGSTIPTLDCKMYQRSADVFLGLPFNIASYALLVEIIAHTLGMKPGNLFISLGDIHLYESHTQVAVEQLERKSKSLPTLKIGKDFVGDPQTFIETLTFEDFKLENYYSHPALKVEMVA